MLKKFIFLIFYFLLYLSPNIFADTIHLKNGNRITGIITKEAENSIDVQINIGAVVMFLKDDIERIERDSESENLQMEDLWESEKSKRKIAMTEDSFTTQAQIDKGLVEYKDSWVTPEEKERLQATEIAEGASKEVRSGEEKLALKNDRVKRSYIAAKLLSVDNWFTRETEHFSFIYTDSAQVKIISDKAEYYFEKIAYDLGYEKDIRWDKKCQVYIIEDAGRWKSFLKDIGFDPELVGGFVPNYSEKEMFLCALYDTYLAVTFPHELTHLIFRDIAGKSTIPLWLNEGLANYEANVTSISNEMLVKYIKRGRHILLGDLLRIAHYPEGKDTSELFYAQSEKLVEFLITQHGRERFRKFCSMILKDKSFKDSLLTAYNGDFADLEDFNIKLVEYMVK